MAHTAPRVIVDDSDKLLDRILAVTDNMPGHPLCGSDQFTVDDEDSVVISFNVTLNHDRAAVLAGLFKPGFYFTISPQVDRDAASVVTGQRLEHHWQSYARCRAHRVARATHNYLLRNRQAKIAQNTVCFFLVRRKFHCNVAGTSRRCRLDTLLIAAMTELHKTVSIEAQPRYVAVFSRLHE